VDEKVTVPVGELPVTVALQVVDDPIVTEFGEQETETDVVVVEVVEDDEVVEVALVELVDVAVLVVV
jgi:hypothetical protein